MTDKPTIAIIGVGSVGSNLGARLCEAGYDVIFGIKPDGSADEAIAKTGRAARAELAPAAAAAGDVVVLAVPGTAVASIVAGLGDLSGKVLVDCTNPLRFDNGPVWNPPAEGSATAAIAAVAPSAAVVKAFSTFGAELHRTAVAGDQPVDVLMAGDSAEAKQTVAAICESAGFAPVDAGPQRNAALLENHAVLWIHLALVEGKGRTFAFKIVD